jgi:hypothetical protein
MITGSAGPEDSNETLPGHGFPTVTRVCVKYIIAVKVACFETLLQVLILKSLEIAPQLCRI